MNIENYTFINQLVLKFVGLYPINITRYIICINCMLLIVIPLVAHIYKNWENLNIILETSSVLLTISLALTKSLIWIFNRKELESFIDIMLTDYWKLVEPDVFTDLQKYAIYAKNVTKGYLFLIVNALLFFYSLPVIDSFMSIIRDTNDNSTVPKNFPFVASYPLTFYKFPFYEIVYISQMLGTCICGLMIVATDTLIASALLHTCGHFKILKRNLRQLDSFCSNMQKNFHSLLFVQTMASSIIICFIGLQVSMTLMDQSNLMKYASHLMMALFQLLLFCFPGDMLISQSSSISRAVYSIQWYKLPLFIKYETSMIMLRSQKPSYITAGKIYVMCLESFSSTLSTALSYFMMLRSFNLEA
ncbi:Putative odorant receptor 13a [Dufourea novaeangliae]|uniref:Odorant receptor n=1 Tax=Dufourea novaeangliae TaxID=178035 RepID=A0A154P1M0_DUFNO|nr:Putative odorant receptor 13a [Dufourea novaeangliae]